MFLILLLCIEILTMLVIRQHFYDRSWMRYYFLVTFNLLVSIWLWILLFRASNYNGIYDEPVNIWMIMNINGVIAAIVIPRLFVIIFHFSGVISKRNTGGHREI
jgi:hypothetical protein